MYVIFIAWFGLLTIRILCYCFYYNVQMFTILYETGILIKLSVNVRTENQELGLKTQILNKLHQSLGTLAIT